MQDVACISSALLNRVKMHALRLACVTSAGGDDGESVSKAVDIGHKFIIA